MGEPHKERAPGYGSEPKSRMAPRKVSEPNVEWAPNRESGVSVAARPEGHRRVGASRVVREHRRMGARCSALADCGERNIRPDAYPAIPMTTRRTLIVVALSFAAVFAAGYAVGVYAWGPS